MATRKRTHSGIGKTARCIAVPLVMALASCGEAPKEPDPLPLILAELKAEREKIGNPARNRARLDILRVEAARAGDETERKGVLAQLHDANPQQQQKAAFMARDIGGKHMIRGLAGVLGDTNGWRFSEIKVSPTGELPQGVMMYAPPSLSAAAMLSQIVENPPAELKGKDWMFYTDADIEIWKNWWEENKAEYEDKGK